VWSTNNERGVARGFMSPPDIADFEARNRSLDDLAAFSEAELALIDLDGAACVFSEDGFRVIATTWYPAARSARAVAPPC
jgi:hypothetical protein